MNDTLKVAGRIGAELGAAKAENEQLRGLLREAIHCCPDEQLRNEMKAALSEQAEPTDTYTAVDMATAAAQGFRDGQAAVEQATAQDEWEAFKRALHSQKVFKLSSATMSAAEWAWFARPAQTAPQGKFSMGDLVKKSTGSEWVGRVVGWYSTEQTKEGYAVESSAHRNSVQIYPVTALEAVE